MIYIIYTAENQTDAEEILHFLTKEKNVSTSSGYDNCYVLHEDHRIAQAAVIVLVSNAAVMDERWQTLVRDIPEEMRLIPVSSTKTSDYADADMIPKKIRDVNYIRMDGKHLENIWDSLTTETGYYEIKSSLILNKNVWHFSKYSDDFLLSDSKKINEYLQLFQTKMQAEKNPYFYDELSEITHYLEASRQYAKKLLRRKALDYFRWGGAVIAAIAYVFFFIKIIDFTNRLEYAKTVISVEASGEIAPINSIKLIDGITNPYISDSAKLELYNKLSEHLDMNWHNTVIGLNYKWALNDAQIAADGQYIWSANGDGGIAKWDTYTGEIVLREKVSDQPLIALAVSPKENLFVALDFDGYIYKKHNEKTWCKSNECYDIPPYAQTKLVCNEERNAAVVSGVNGKLLYLNLKSGFNLLWEGQYDKIFCTEISDRGVEAVIQKGDILYDLCIEENGIVAEIPIPVKWYNGCAMDIQNGVVIMADQTYQIVTWSKAIPEKINPAGFVLSKPICLCFLNDQIIAYSDRNMGTHLYDLSRKLDLGVILWDATAVTSLSASTNAVMAYLGEGNVCCSENIELLLPLNNIYENEIYAAYTGKAMSSSGILQQVSIENEYIIRAVLKQEAEDIIHIIDGGSHYYIGQSQCDFSLVEENGTNIFYYEDKPVYFSGKPTVIGIADHGEVLLVGSSDGSFFETIFTETGYFLRGSHFQVPSHASIIGIYQTADYYYLKDITGTFWRARIGYNAVTPEGAVAAVKERLHCAANNEIYEVVSDDTIKALDVKCLPGGGTEEWE